MEGSKRGLLYMPVISEEELKAFQERGTVVVDDPEEGGRMLLLIR
jgi:hypothetical protein